MSILSQLKQSQNTDFPNLRPSLDLRFALAKKLDPRITFTRGSTGTYFGSDGIMRTAGVNEPRFDHNPITGQSLGLLIEESRTNLIANSNTLSSWGAVSVPILTQDVVGLDGQSNTGWTVNDQYTLGDGAFIERSVSITPSTNPYCFSVFVKRGTAIWFDMYAFFIGTSTRAVYLNYNWGTQTLSVGSAENSPPVPTIYGKIDYPNGWSRFYLVFSDPIGTNTNFLLRLYPSSRNAGYVGSTLFYGAQVEAGSSPTSYIPTTASTVTRSADLASMTGTNFSSWYNQSEGTIYLETDKLYLGNFDAYRHPYKIDSGSNADQITAYTLPGSTAITNYGIVTGGRQVNDYQQINIGSSPIKYKLGQSVNSKYFFFTTSTGRVSPQLPSKSAPNTHNLSLATNMSRLFIGNNAGGGQINSHISRLTYYPIQLTNQQLINLVS